MVERGLLDTLKRQLTASYRERLAALETERLRIEADYRTSLEALSNLRRTAGSDARQLASLRTDRPAKSLREAVETILATHELGDLPISINVIIEWLIVYHPEIPPPHNPTSVSGVLRSLEKEGILKLVERGKGPKPSLYRITDFGRAELAAKSNESQFAL
jgi:hypothetical protein